MSNQNYTLEIISHHPKFDKKSLRKYYVDGIETVGAWGDEPFEIVFKNHTWQKVQVKLSIDGTDILTGDKANTEVSKDMWVVNGYGTLSLKAWPETNNGGAQLVFTSANNSVAVHTHGDLSCRGIIAAAVFTESYVPPAVLNVPVHHYHHYDYYRRMNWWDNYDLYSSPIWIGGIYTNNTSGDLGSGNSTFSSTTVTNSISPQADGGTFTANSCSYNATADAPRARKSKSLESLVAVGAGDHVDQKIVHVEGLVKPSLAETVRVRYLWWDDLVAKLKEHNVPAPHASGFPGDKKQHIMSLGNTPRIGSFSRAFPREQAEPMYSRI